MLEFYSGAMRKGEWGNNEMKCRNTKKPGTPLRQGQKRARRGPESGKAGDDWKSGCQEGGGEFIRKLRGHLPGPVVSGSFSALSKISSSFGKFQCLSYSCKYDLNSRKHSSSPRHRLIKSGISWTASHRSWICFRETFSASVQFRVVYAAT